MPEGDVCTTPDPSLVRLRVRPARIVAPPGQRRMVRVVVDPDVCGQLAVRVSSSDATVAWTAAEASVDYGSPEATLDVRTGSVGEATLTVAVARGDGTDATVDVPIEVRSDARMICSSDDDVAPTLLTAGGAIRATGSLAGAGIELPEGADRPNEGSFVWSVQPFDASISCAPDIVPEDTRSLGPAVRFGPDDERFARELPVTLPLNLARIPEQADWHHVRLAFASGSAAVPRLVPATNLRLDEVDGILVARADVPRLGTYQLVVRRDAGTRTFGRRLSHRAIIGLSMGAAGAAQLGLRRHELFDVVAALGGPVDGTWLAHQFESHYLAGFAPIASGTTLDEIALERAACNGDGECSDGEICLGASTTEPNAGRCTRMPPADEPYEHPSTFNTLWYESVGTGNGEAFSRQSYMQLFRDVALAYGNPAGFNARDGAENLPAGIDPDGPSQTGGHEGDECSVWVEPTAGDPNYDALEALAESCARDRCANGQTLANYFDDEYNPDGSFPVITFCDGSPQAPTRSPYAATWSPEGNDYPAEMLLAVDYNGNGVRDELEPVIRAGHEHWDDVGIDGVPSELEPGFGAEHPDPSGDDYDPQYNPTGTEGDHRWQPGEPFDDHGLDGVPGTADSPFDYGEGDEELTVAPGLQRLWELDAHSAVRGWTTEWPSGPLDDAALRRIDLWTDGGLRDLFNSAVAARHLVGAFAARGRRVSYFGGFDALPGAASGGSEPSAAGNVFWDDVPGTVLLRYGAADPTGEDLASGSGQRVGSATEAVRRLESAFYFVGSRWPDASRARVAPSEDAPDPDASACELVGRCELELTGSTGRTGPVVVWLPPGYAHVSRKDERFPVVFLLHGYGGSPDDWNDTRARVEEWMSDPTLGQGSRLPRMIVVLVDGRCRSQEGGAECLRGTFYTDSARARGPQLESWWLELIDRVDARFRTMGESKVTWGE